MCPISRKKKRYVTVELNHFIKFIQKAFNHSSPLISSISKLAMCDPWSRSGSNYLTDSKYLAYKIVGKHYLLVASITSGENVCVSRMNDAYI